MALKRGTPVIINDTDCPQNNLIAVIMRCTKDGIWRARYLSTYPHMIYCWTGRDTPTPIDDFGVKLEWSDGGEFRTVPNGKPCVARYRDGKPRNWQQRGQEWWPSRPAARDLLDELKRERSPDMTTLSAETAVAIAVAHQEIARGENLLADVRKAIAERNGRSEFGVTAESDLRDVFGRRQNSLQLGIPSGSSGHKICDMSYDLAVPVIEAHIANKRSELQALSIKARAELTATGE